MSLTWNAERLAEHGLVGSVEHRPIPAAPQNLTEIYDSTLAAEPSRIALVGRSGELSYGALEAQVNAACGYLAELGVSETTRVAVSLANDIHVVVAFLAVQRLGAIWVGINRAYVLSERCHLLTDAGVEVLISEPKIAAETTTLASSLPAIRHIVILDAADPSSSQWHRGLQRHRGANRPRVRVDPFGPAAIAYTSGTTGVPKGVVHSQHNILVSATLAELMALDKRPEVIRGSASSLTILNVMILGPVATLARGLRTVCVDRVDACGVAEWIRNQGINTMALVPTTVLDLLTRPDIDQKDLSSLTWIVVGAAMVPEALAKLYRDRFGHDFTVSYGLTEMPTTVSRTHPQSPRSQGAIGRPLLHLEVGIMDENGSRVVPGQSGEICVRAAKTGPWADVYTAPLGYWNKPEATAKLLSGGWLHTGDIGYMEESGELFIQDRRNDLINRGGANIYPAEIERVLRAEPGLHDCAVAGRPDERLGQSVAAYVQPSAGVDADELVRRLQQRCAREIAKYKMPAHWVVVQSLPRNAMGKIVKSQLTADLGRTLPAGGLASQGP